MSAIINTIYVFSLSGFIHEENLMKMAKFNKSIGLPVTLADMDLNQSHLEALTQAATKTNEWKNAPFPFTKEEFIAAIKKADAVGQSL